MSRNTRRDAEPSTKNSSDNPELRRLIFSQAFDQTRKLFDNPQVDDLQALLVTHRGRDYQIDQATSVFSDKGEAECGPGCSFCCHQLVLCTPFEIFLIARFLLDTKSKTELEAITARLSKLAPLPLDADSRYGRDKPCAFLEDDRCSIYEQRPSVCRTLLSASRKACEMCLGGDDVPVPYIGNTIVIAAAMQMGIDYALIKCRNLNTERVELSRALLMALNNFDGAVVAWASGGSPFPDCAPLSEQDQSNRKMCTAAAARFGCS